MQHVATVALKVHIWCRLQLKAARTPQQQRVSPTRELMALRERQHSVDEQRQRDSSSQQTSILAAHKHQLPGVQTSQGQSATHTKWSALQEHAAEELQRTQRLQASRAWKAKQDMELAQQQAHAAQEWVAEQQAVHVGVVHSAVVPVEGMEFSNAESFFARPSETAADSMDLD